jgi:hypothetical protein
MGLFYHLWWYINIERSGIIVGRTLKHKQKFSQLSLCPLNSPHGITQIKGQASATRSQQLNLLSYGMARHMHGTN